MKLFTRLFRKAPPPARPATAGTPTAKPLQQLPDGDALRRLAGLSDQERAAQTLAAIDDPAQVARLVVESPSSRLRQLAAQTIEDPAQLRLLLKQVRAKDKSVYKILKQKCDALNAESRRTTQIANDINDLCASLERHSHRSYDPLYTPTFEQLDSRWRSLATPPQADIEQRASQAIDRCREVIAAHLRQIAQRAAALAAEQAGQQAARDLREHELQAAQEAALVQTAADIQARKEADAVREAHDRARAEKRAAEDQVFHRIGGLIRSAQGALRDGNTQKAAALRRAIAEKLPRAPAAATPEASTAPEATAVSDAPAAPALPTYLARHLQQLDDELNELKQWKDYAVAPKRVLLIEEMESLIGAAEDPQVLADRVQSLQQEWRTISKGIVSEAPQDWERFHQASQAAYQPAREYFETQAKRRHENLEKRRAVLERLGAFEAAQAALATQAGQAEGALDWRLLTTVLREAPQEWRRYSPVDREAGRALQGEFDASMARLRATLETWHERNVAAKQSLIKRARSLLTQEDSREAIEAAKRLQLLWKETGQAPRDQEQPLWSEFREVCDAIYQKRQQAYAEYTAGLEAAKLNAVALCEEAERTAASSGTTLLEGAGKIPEWRAAFDALDEMPRGDARGLHDRFERALDLCKAQVAQQYARDAERSVMNLLEAGRHIRVYGWSVARTAAPSEQETLKQAAEAFIAGVQHWPKGGLQAVTETLAKADSWTEAGSEAREKALRMLCVRCEIQSETASPPEDEALRREYQVQRLVQGMGRGHHADEGDWAAMMLEWIRIGAVSPAVHESLQERFMRSHAKRADKQA